MCCHAVWLRKILSDMCMQECLHLCLYSTGICRAIVNVFSRDKIMQDISKTDPDTNLNYAIGTTRLLSSYAGINKVKET